MNCVICFVSISAPSIDTSSSEDETAAVVGGVLSVCLVAVLVVSVIVVAYVALAMRRKKAAVRMFQLDNGYG